MSAAPATMRAAVIPGVGRSVEVIRRPRPQPGPGEVLVRVDACGVCGSDLFLQKGGFGAGTLPRVPGHEASGTVEALGEGADGLRPGDQVALYYIDTPPESPWRRAGRENLDPDLRRMGVDVDGAFAEYVVRPAHTLIKPPAAVDPAALAVLTDAVATPYHALVAIAGVQAQETVLVLGVGGIGSNAVQLARLLGADVVAASRSAAKLELARRLGATTVVATGGDRPAAAIRQALDGTPIDVVLQCVGSAAMDELAIEVAGPGARVVLVGAATDAMRIRAVDLIWRELSVRGSRGFTAADIEAVLALHHAGKIDVDHLLGNDRPLEEADQALEDLRSGRVLRTVLRPQS